MNVPGQQEGGGFFLHFGVAGARGGQGGKLSLKTRFDLARKAFAHTAAYDAAIAAYFAQCPFAAVQQTYRIMT